MRCCSPTLLASCPICRLPHLPAACCSERHTTSAPAPPNATLLQAGFVQLSERQGWEGVAPGGRYFFTRNASTLVRPSLTFFAQLLLFVQLPRLYSQCRHSGDQGKTVHKRMWPVAWLWVVPAAACAHLRDHVIRATLQPLGTSAAGGICGGFQVRAWQRLHDGWRSHRQVGSTGVCGMSLHSTPVMACRSFCLCHLPCQAVPCSCHAVPCSCQAVPCSCHAVPCSCHAVPCSCHAMPDNAMHLLLCRACCSPCFKLKPISRSVKSG